jgi:hypothetical protein
VETKHGTFGQVKYEVWLKRATKMISESGRCHQTRNSSLCLDLFLKVSSFAFRFISVMDLRFDISYMDWNELHS